MDFRPRDKFMLAGVAVVFFLWGFARCSGGRSEEGGAESGQGAGAKKYTPGQVFIAWDSVRLRSGPSRDSTSLGTLYQSEPLTYTGKYSDFTEEITDGGIKYSEPWVEVRTVDNKTGWVFGGSVRLYPRR